MQPNGYIKVAAMPGGSLPTTRRHLPTQQKGGILYPIIKIPYNNSKNTSTTNPITISNNTNTTTNNTTVINYNPIIPSTAPNRRKLPTTTAANNGISGSGKLDCNKVLPPSKSLNSAVTPITPINTTGYELIWIDYNNGVSGSTGNDNKPNLKEPEVDQPEVENTGMAVLPLPFCRPESIATNRPLFYNILWPVLVTGLFSLTYEWLMWHYFKSYYPTDDDNT